MSTKGKRAGSNIRHDLTNTGASPILASNIKANLTQVYAAS
jgi:hypothetical protein